MSTATVTGPPIGREGDPFVSELEDDFKATVENIAQDARELAKIEQSKAELDPADPEARTLSARAEALAEQLHHKTLAEQDLTETAAADA
jgi:capsule polysaccharide export protein KpsE/RkpR